MQLTNILTVVILASAPQLLPALKSEEEEVATVDLHPITLQTDQADHQLKTGITLESHAATHRCNHLLAHMARVVIALVT